jgi:polyhydroxyalkanoate synthesis regulator phasin
MIQTGDLNMSKKNSKKKLKQDIELLLSTTENIQDILAGYSERVYALEERIHDLESLINKAKAQCKL